MRAALLITAKDLRARVRDRSAFLVGIVVPLGLAFIFNLIFSGISGGSGIIALGVVDQDHGPVAQAFVQGVLGPVSRDGLISVRAEATEADARALVARGTLKAMIVIPAGFSEAVQTGQAASLSVTGNADSPISTLVARSITEGYAADLNRVRLSVATVAHGSPAPLTPAQLGAIAQEAAATAAPIAVRDVSSSTKQLDQKSFYSAGMAVFFLFFTVQFGVMGLLSERSEGTLSRLLAAPVSRVSILAGKLITSFLLGVVSMGVLVVATTLMFGASWGSPIGVAILVAAAVLAATGIAALVASLARNVEDANNWQTIVAVILGLIGGTFFPVAQAPGILSKVTFIAPQAWFLRGLGDLRGGDLSAVWLPALAMLGFAAVTGGVAVARLRRLGEA